MPRGKPMKNPNGYGSVVKLSGRRRKPFEVRVNTRMDERYYPVYDVLGRFEEREQALIALAEYNKSPYNISDREITFAQLYEKFYKNKYELSGKTYSDSTRNCTKSAYGHCKPLYDISYSKLRVDDFRGILGQMNTKGKPLSHAMQEHIKNLFTQMDKFALQNDVIEKGYASFAAITVEEDDEPGVPFTAEELQTLWNNKDVPWVDSILIYIYSGWRVSELIRMPTEDIDLQEGLFKGGLKTAAGKNRIVPIHSKIREFVENRLNTNNGILLAKDGQTINVSTYRKLFKETLKAIGINTHHTPHDCRHTFTSLLDSAGANQVCIDRLIGHASDSITTRTYTHTRA
ncbi:MAG: tyrosine-type recombinase/integrase [Lachnospiraceae bacterium]|nr:tyrosine-type recombinase/integrase [Lachnospiraceae bacterium]